MESLDIQAKVENNGINNRGRISAEDINKIVYAINENASDCWEDLRFQLIGRKLDITSGRIDYDFVNNCIQFQSNARYPDEPIGIVVEMPHSWKEGTNITPHIHWLQKSETKPNWLLGYRKIKAGTTVELQSDYSNYTLVTLQDDEFAYNSGDSILQISNFPEIDMSDMHISDLVELVLFRDSQNTSGLFQQANSTSEDEYLSVVDVHFIKDGIGSKSLYPK